MYYMFHCFLFLEDSVIVVTCLCLFLVVLEIMTQSLLEINMYRQAGLQLHVSIWSYSS